MGHAVEDYQSTGPIVTGSTGSVNVRLSEGFVLRHVSATSANSRAPLHVSIRLRGKGGFLHHIRDGWIRGYPTILLGGSLSWNGEIPIPRPGMRLGMLVENDTGADGAVTLMWIGERR